MTGWTWEHVHDRVTLHQVLALSAYWRRQPPLPVLAAKLCQYFGIKTEAPPPPKPAETAQDFLREAMAAGMPVMHGRPDDPMLAFLDLP